MTFYRLFVITVIDLLNLFQMVFKKILAFFIYKGILQKISESLTIRNAARLTAHMYFKGKQVNKHFTEEL